MKKGFNILMIVFAAAVLFSCDKTKSYTEMLKDEKKAINNLIDENGFKILKDYPANGVFAENEFVKLDNDVYLNVVDSGNGNRATIGKTTVLMRVIGQFFMTDTFNHNGFTSYTDPIIFKYGYNTTIDNQYISTLFLGEGLVSALEYVGDSASVKMIIPFKLGSEYSNNNGLPTYIKKSRIIFDK